MQAALSQVLTDWLNSGRVLISPPQCHQAIVEAYQLLQGASPTPEVEQELVAMVDAINAASAESLVIPGLENWVVRSVMVDVRARGWGRIQYLRKPRCGPEAEALFDTWEAWLTARTKELTAAWLALPKDESTPRVPSYRQACVDALNAPATPQDACP